MAMLTDSICLIQGHVKSIDKRLANLEEALATPQTSMADLTTLDLDSGGVHFVSVPTAQDHINPSLCTITPSSQSLPSSSSSISSLIYSLPVDQQMEFGAFDRELQTELAMSVAVWIPFSRKTRWQLVTMTAAGINEG